MRLEIKLQAYLTCVSDTDEWLYSNSNCCIPGILAVEALWRSGPFQTWFGKQFQTAALTALLSF